MARIFRHYVSPVKLTIATVDFIVVAGAAFVAEWARYSWLDLDMGGSWEALLAKILFPVFFIPILLGMGGYQSDAIRDVKVFFVRLLAAVTATGVTLAALLYLLPMLPFWRSILLLTMLISGAGLLLVHLAFLSLADNKLLSRKVIILGAGEQALEIENYAGKATEAGLNIICSIILPGQKVVAKTAVAIENLDQLDTYAQERQAELILIATDGLGDLPIEALIACKLNGVEIKDRLSFFEQVRGYVDLSSVQAEWIIFSDGFKGGSAIERISKRILDVFISVVLLFAAAPVMALAAVAVRLTSFGPIFYRQERIGMFGKPFSLLKFRSMKNNAEKVGEPKWAEVDDPRLTLAGGFLRKTRIDELPQIVNVLRGQMSFVGPRPERPYFVSQFEDKIPFYRERHCLKPGITGWAQIQYPYGASFEDSKRKLEYDLYYIKNYSIFLDILIILQTVRVILFPIGVR